MVPLIFANLHAVHDYYAYANGIFLLGALGLGLLGLLEAEVSRRRIGVGLLFGLLMIGLTGYARGYLQVQRRDHRQLIPLGDELRRMTNPEDVVLIYGWDWSPELPYLAQRRALMDRQERSLDDPAMREAVDNLKREGRQIAMLAACFSSRFHTQVLAQAQARLSFAASPVYSDLFCDLYPVVEHEPHRNATSP